MAKHPAFNSVSMWQAKQDNQRKQEIHEQKMKHAQELHEAKLAKIKRSGTQASPKPTS